MTHTVSKNPSVIQPGLTDYKGYMETTGVGKILSGYPDETQSQAVKFVNGLSEIVAPGHK